MQTIARTSLKVSDRKVNASPQNDVLVHKDDLLRHKDALIELQQRALDDAQGQLKRAFEKISELEKQIIVERQQWKLLFEAQENHCRLRLEENQKLVAKQIQSKSPSPSGLTVSFAGSEDDHLPSLSRSSCSNSGLTDKKQKKTYERFLEVNESLAGFTKLRTFGPPALKHMLECIKDGADICYQSMDMERPVLHCFIERRIVACVEVCLRTPHSIDYTIVDNEGYTPLLLVARHSCHSPTKAVDILKLIVRRLESQPLLDNVDWGGKSRNGFDFVSIAADYESLSLVWPVIRMQPYFRNLTEPLPLHVKVHKLDWERLGPDRTLFFNAVKGIR